MSKFETIEKAIIFRSRSMGNYKKDSDVDIAILGEQITS
ncbi:nucleotidyltransferase domain-containing protein [Clostridium estertheticum]|nr:nucleotidyltransferase domain-containing protein [Clostridium estertheticum]MBU3198395.1 nucleotidyltransferase domain-containing protein [Clostridium estertheticum]WAG68109.1 nucleotidyltransferase domain-containing protein [Clostridium estertheticum]